MNAQETKFGWTIDQYGTVRVEAVTGQPAPAQLPGNRGCWIWHGGFCGNAFWQWSDSDERGSYRRQQRIASRNRRAGQRQVNAMMRQALDE